MQKWSRLNYQPCLPLGPNGTRATESLEHRMLSRRAAAEGAVLLKNEGVLPLSSGASVAVFGKGIADYVKGGGGSGDVTVSYIKTLLDGLRDAEKEGKLTVDKALADYYESYVKGEYQKGIEPGLVVEPEFPEALATEAASKTQIAVLAISRFSGENWDRASEDAPLFSTYDDTMALLKRQAEVFERGDFYLSEKERAMVEGVKKHFSSVIVVLNAGGIMDVTWIHDDASIKGALQAFQGGMEGGSAIVDLLTGAMNPSGRLSDTYARRLSDYPSSATYHDSLDYVEYQDDIFVGYRYFSTIPGAEEKVVYPFGYGLSYTSFSFDAVSSSFTPDGCSVKVEVKNTGLVPGKDVVELYMLPPRGKLTKPRRVLASFGKTPVLEKGECTTLTLSFSFRDFASYDEEGVVSEASWILEKGEYQFALSDDAIHFSVASAFVLEEDLVLEKLSHKAQASLLSRVLREDGTYVTHEAKKTGVESGIPRQEDLDALEGIIPNERGRDVRITRADLQEIERTKSLALVAEGKMTMEAFIAQLPDEVLFDMVGGQPNRGVADTYGFGNQIEFGIPNVMTADGPAGLRIVPDRGVCTTAWPCSTLLASSWDKDLVEEVGKAAGLEVKENNIGLWLSPAVNIHRSPLCGRNFEYYSEDPLLCGVLASSMVKGVQSNGIGACAKHYACNNKETNRKDSDSRVSERALREIYLKQFEIIIKTSQPLFVMTSYNVVNGIRAAENKDLITGILREEWGFAGAVCSDWWNHSEHYLELLAGQDLKMGNGFPERVEEAFEKGLITRKDLEENVKHILSAILRLA